jgi:hypothetical protein
MHFVLVSGFKYQEILLILDTTPLALWRGVGGEAFSLPIGGLG